MLLARKDFFGGATALIATTVLGANAKLPRDKYGKIIDGFGDSNPGLLQDKPWEPFSEKTGDFLRGILVPGHKVCVDLETALDTTICGICAHMSAMKDGETLKIPELA